MAINMEAINGCMRGVGGGREDLPPAYDDFRPLQIQCMESTAFNDEIMPMVPSKVFFRGQEAPGKLSNAPTVASDTRLRELGSILRDFTGTAPRPVSATQLSAHRDASAKVNDEPAIVPLPRSAHIGDKVVKESCSQLDSENRRLAMENELLRMHCTRLTSIAFPRSDSAAMAAPQKVCPAWQVNGYAKANQSGFSGSSHKEQSVAQRKTSASGGSPMMRSSSSSNDVSVESDTDVDQDNCIGSDSPPSTGPLVTLMLRNLPNNYSRRMLLALMDEEGFAGKYDFVYLPIDFKSQASLGYAFINLVNEEEARRFAKHFNGFSRWALPSQKVCRVSWSMPHQGLEAHIERYRNSPVMHEGVSDEFKPALFENGTRSQFPPPTKKIRAPRMRPGRNSWNNSVRPAAGP